MHHVDSANLERHLRELTEQFGVRLAGSDAEKRAAAYVADRLSACGAAVSVETFACHTRAVEDEQLDVFIGGRWQRFGCSLLGVSPGTEGRAIEAPLVFFDSHTEYARPDLAHLKGKAVVHLGSHIESRAHYRRLIEAEPAFLLFVDSRYPGALPLGEGLFPAYVAALGARPVVSVAYMDAWNWKQDAASAARLRVRGGRSEGVSQNVVAEFRAEDPLPGLLFVGAHHDTQAGTAGADDNASGVAGVLELARVLAGEPRRRTVRLVSFGCEEQLSVGSAAYVRAHRRELDAAGGLMFNLDSYGSLMGWTILLCNGPAGMGPFFTPFFERQGEWVRLDEALTPYTDHFPFAAAGLASAWLGRRNCEAGRFFHHRPDDDLSRVSPKVMATLLDAVAQSLAHLGRCEPPPFALRADERQRPQIEAMWQDLFGGW